MEPKHPADGTDLCSAASDSTPEAGGGISRRTFLLASAALTSCSAAVPLRPEEAVKTPSNTGYRTPSFSGAVPRNPDMPYGSDFSRGAGITFTRVPVAGKFIAITYDDGPHPQNTPRLLDILRARNVKATFYVIGRSVDLYPQIVRRTVAEGHEIGNHSYTHRLMSKLGDSEVRSEMSRTADSVMRAGGVRMKTMRPPYGGLLQRQRELVHQEYGYPTILWSVDPLDWKRPGASVITSRILENTAPGGIVLAHDLHAQTVDSMPATLDGLLRRGFQFVTVSQLIAMKQEPAATPPSLALGDS
jgi:peptidoglycan/xylan/chitin deacetylase (PgdA/CDA1 family)